MLRCSCYRGEDRKWRELATLLTDVIFTPAAIANRVAEDKSSYSAGNIAKPTPSPRQHAPEIDAAA